MLLSAPGSIIANRFVIEALAGGGGMGSVYRARDLSRGTPIALKVLHAAQPSAQEAERFSREARLLASLEHPGIVRYIEHGHTDERLPFLAMEWLDGEDLEQRLLQKGLTLTESLQLVRCVAAALSVAHRRGIVHRDLKPSNLFLRDGDVAQVTLLDFGIARPMVISHVLTRAGALVGTPGYMAPEQARGQSDLHPSADLFALGCVLFECLTGRPPFAGEHLEAILARILFEPAPRLHALRPELPEALDRLVSELLAKDPLLRPQNAMAFLEMLNRLELPSETVADPTVRVGDSRALTSVEQQLVNVLIARNSALSPAEDPTLKRAVVEEEQQRLAALREELSALRVHTEVLADGTLVAALTAGREAAATDQAQRAAHCALLVHERWPEALVALATGRGVINGQLPIGEAINKAARLMSAAASRNEGRSSYAAILDEVTAGLLDARFRTQRLEEGAVALLGEQSSVDESRRLLGKPTPCLGREPELGMLDATLSACIEEASARALIVLGPPGAGKSRLRHEFLRRVAAREEDVLLLMGRADLIGGGAPFALLREALLTMCGVQPSDGLEVRGEKLRERISRVLFDASRDRCIAFLGELCGVPFPEQQDTNLRGARQQPRLMEECIRHAFLEWLRAECVAQPVLLVLENLQWGDMATIDLLDLSLRELLDRPFFVLALARPEVNERFARLWHDRVQTVPLRPLSRKASEQLVRVVLGSQEAPAVVARIVERAAGNALYLEELIRSTAEGQGEELPPTILAMLQARIRWLEPEARRALRAASVFGEAVWVGGVAALLGAECDESKRWLEHLLRMEMLEDRAESRFAGEAEYHFRHDMMRDAAYSLLSDEDRARGHRLAAAFLEPLGESAPVLAYHFQEAGELAKALRYYIAAGDRAAQVSLLSEARRHYATARQALLRQPESADTIWQHVDLLLKQVQCGLSDDSIDIQLERLHEARRLLQSQSEADNLREARIDYYCGRVYHFGGQPIEAIRCYQRVLPVARQLGDQSLLVLPTFAIGTALCVQGMFGRAHAFLAEVVDPIEQSGDSVEWTRCLSYYAFTLAASGRYREAMSQAERGLVYAIEVNHPPALARFRIMQGGSHLLTADWPATLAAGQSVLDLARLSPEKVFHYCGLDLMAWSESHLGQHEQALAQRAQAREIRKLVGGGILADWFEAGEAEILLNAGRAVEAQKKAAQVVAESAAHDLMFSQAVAERVWACALAQLGQPLAEIEAHFRAALEICTAHEQLVNAGLTEAAWGRICRARGDESRALSHFLRGIAMLEQAGCHYAASAARRRAMVSGITAPSA